MPHHCRPSRRYFSVLASPRIGRSLEPLHASVYAIHPMSRRARGNFHFSEVIQLNHEAVASLLAKIWGSWDAAQVHGNRKGGAGGDTCTGRVFLATLSFPLFSIRNCSLWISDTREDPPPFWRGQLGQVATAESPFQNVTRFDAESLDTR